MNELVEHVARIYERMASRCRYRPGAPSDGLGHITMPLEELDLHAEARDWARAWVQADDDCTHVIRGCSDWTHREAMVYALEAARSYCSGSLTTSLTRDLLEAALDSLPSQVSA